jgi:hypothetical protein
MSAAKLVNIIYKQSEYENMIGMVADQIMTGQDEADKKAMIEFLSEHVSIKKMEEDLIEIYSRYFLENEIEDLTEFYSTPIGQKYISVGSKLGLDVINLVNKRIQDNLDKLPKTKEIKEDEEQ